MHSRRRDTGIAMRPMPQSGSPDLRNAGWPRRTLQMPIKPHGRRLQILTWHVHGNYLYYLTQVPHDFHIVMKPGHPPGYARRAGVLPWGDNVHEVMTDDVRQRAFDCVLYQHRSHYANDRIEVLSAAQRN